ncbi:MAG: PQQ-like beta-propeller repeat protein [Candidatus Bathyarchaeota archaeon]|nr:PQQ-like beta-propeller repeat protein [Candidatus Bathyarchaeota archaeon]
MTLLLTTSAFMAAIPTAEAEGTMSTYTYLVAIPNPVQVNQPAYVTGWLDLVPPYAVSHGGDPWIGITIDVTKPDGSTETLGPFNSDPISGFWALYTPNQVGTYTFQAHFPGQTIDIPEDTPRRWLPPDEYYFQPSDSNEVELTVQEEATPTWQDTPVPDTNTYWTRPINAVHRNWYAISGNWLSAPDNRYAAYTRGPESAHIIWTKPYGDGGLVGGEYGSHSYHEGRAYENKFANSVVINGVLYYKEYGYGHSQYWTDIVAVDLQTGEEIWRNNSTGRGDPVSVVLSGGGANYGNWEGYPTLSFGQIYYYSSPNQHGAFAYLWATGGSGSTARWDMYDAFTGDWILSFTGVPSGTRTFGPNGEILIYQVNTANGWMALWNSSDAIPLAGPDGTDAWQYRLWPGTTLDVSKPYTWTIENAAGRETSWEVNPYTWNVSIPTDLSGSIWTVLDDRIIGSDLGQRYYSYDPWSLWAISLKPGEEGNLMWHKQYHAPEGNVTMERGTVSLEDGIFVLREKELNRWNGYSLETGEKVWGPTEPQITWDAIRSAAYIADSKLYTAGYGGVLYCYDVHDGTLLWKYEASDPTGEALYGANFPTEISFIADGKIYLQTGEHSPINPPHRGSRLRCISSAGEELWTISMWTENPVISDGYIAALDDYDLLVYAYGKGETETTVLASPKVVGVGNGILIEGSVTDQSPGAKDTPAIADEYMTEWMEYLYKQFPIPGNAKGVQVTLTAIDPNGAPVTIGTTTCNMDGKYGFAWTPDMEGKYEITATFEGSKSYWPSYSTTYLSVSSNAASPNIVSPSPSPDTAVNPPTSATPTTTYIAIAAAVIIIIVAIAAVTIFRRKR